MAKKLFEGTKKEAAKFSVSVLIFLLVKAVTETLSSPDLTWNGIIGIYMLIKFIELLESTKN
ncbi:MAG: hypothetical protein KAK00_07320 [Nanoarchaeota archaeon]|nr:hypothetical protein [Nanoarchaeota archaeon]